MVTSTWPSRERRILDYVLWAWERNERVEVAHIAEALDLDYALVVRVVDELRKDDQLTGVEVAQEPYLLRVEPSAVESRCCRRLHADRAGARAPRTTPDRCADRRRRRERVASRSARTGHFSGRGWCLKKSHTVAGKTYRSGSIENPSCPIAGSR